MISRAIFFLTKGISDWLKSKSMLAERKKVKVQINTPQSYPLCCFGVLLGQTNFHSEMSRLCFFLSICSSTRYLKRKSLPKKKKILRKEKEKKKRKKKN